MRAGQASNQATDVGQVNAGHSTQRGQVGGNAPSRGQLFFRVTRQAERPASTLQASPRANDRKTHCCFLAAGEACELWPTEARLPQARSVESAEEISDEGAEPILRAAGPDEGGARRAGADTYNPSGQSMMLSTDYASPLGCPG